MHIPLTPQIQGVIPPFHLWCTESSSDPIQGSILLSNNGLLFSPYYHVLPQLWKLLITKLIKYFSSFPQNFSQQKDACLCIHNDQYLCLHRQVITCSLFYFILIFGGFFFNRAAEILFFQRLGLDMLMIAWLAHVEKHHQRAQQLLTF